MKLIIVSFLFSTLTAGLTGCGTTYTRTTPVVYSSCTGSCLSGYSSICSDIYTSSVCSEVNILTGQLASEQDLAVFCKKGVVYKYGHAYSIQDRRYVLLY